MHMLRFRSSRGGVLFDVILLLLLLILIYKFLQRYDVPLPQVKVTFQSKRGNEKNEKTNNNRGSDTSIRKTQKGDDYNENVLEKIGRKTDSKSAMAIDSRIQRLPDPRSSQCKQLRYDKELVSKKATLVLAFTDYELEDAKVTITSVLYNEEVVDQAALAEIILVDAGSSLQYIRDEADKFVNFLNSNKPQSSSSSNGERVAAPSPPARLIRVETHTKVGKSEEQKGQHYRHWPRTIGMRACKTDIVVFLDPGVVVARGWLAPLLAPLAAQGNGGKSSGDISGQLAIVEAHHDRITSPINLVYETTSEDTITVPTWSMSIAVRRLSEVPSNTSAPYRNVPAIRGSAFAVKRSVIRQLGGLYDEVLDVDGGGEHLELSLRLWMCSGGIKQSLCSRVGVPEIDAERKVVSPHNARHIADLWLGSHGYLVYHIAGVRSKEDLAAAGETEEEFLQRHRLLHDRKMASSSLSAIKGKCYDFNWYLRNAALGSMAVPATTEPVHFGVLQAQSDMCASVEGGGDRLLMDDCKPNEVPKRKLLFEYTKDRRFVTNTGLCLSVINHHFVGPAACTFPTPKHQRWTFNGNGATMVSEQNGMCLTHVSDPDPKFKGRQIAMAQDCRSGQADEKKYENFRKWHFKLP